MADRGPAMTSSWSRRLGQAAGDVRDRFSNVVDFRGFPHIPGQDTVIRYPNRGDANSGDVL